MATKKRRKKRHARRRGWTHAKRVRAGRKAWRKRLRRYPKKSSSVKRRGYRNNPRKRRRKHRRNPLAIRGGMYSNPKKKRRRSRRRGNPLAIRGGMYSNPRRGRKGRRRARRNPFSLGGTMGGITKTLTSPESLMQFAAGAAGATASQFAGTVLMGYVRKFTTKTTGLAFDNPTMDSLLAGAVNVAAGILIAGFLPAKFKSAFMIGAGATAVKPWIDSFVGPLLASTGLAVPVPAPSTGSGTNGIGAWISTGQLQNLGRGSMNGMGAWITANQAKRLGQGTAGLGRLGAYAWDYGVPVAGMDDYSRQPVATLQNVYGQ